MHEISKPNWGIVIVSAFFFFASVLISGFGGGKASLISIAWLFIGWYAYRGRHEDIKISIKVFLITTLILIAVAFFVYPSDYFFTYSLIVIFLSTVPKICLFFYLKERIGEEENSLAPVNKSKGRDSKINSSKNLIDDLQTNDEEYYEQAYDEFHSKNRKKGLYLKHLTNFDGNKERAEYEYIKSRVTEYKKELKAQKEAEHALDLVKLKGDADSLKLIMGNKFETIEVNGVECLLLLNGEGALKLKDGKYRIYRNEDTVRKSASYYSKMGQYLANGYVKTVSHTDIPITETKMPKKITRKAVAKLVDCPSCYNKFDLNSAEITSSTVHNLYTVHCPNCRDNWAIKI